MEVKYISISLLVIFLTVPNQLFYANNKSLVYILKYNIRSFFYLNNKYFVSHFISVLIYCHVGYIIYIGSSHISMKNVLIIPRIMN